jgi:hypothetical protein
MSERSERIIVTASVLTGVPPRPSNPTRHESVVHQ